MGGRTEGVSHYKKGVVVLMVVGNLLLENAVDLYLAEVPICLNELNPQEVFKILVVAAHH
jgi:hypothetical protein